MQTYGGGEISLHAFLTSALDVAEWFPFKKQHPYPQDGRLGGPPSRYEDSCEEKNTVPTGNRNLFVHPVA